MASKASNRTVRGGGTNSTTSGTEPCHICRGTGRVPKTYYTSKSKGKSKGKK